MLYYTSHKCHEYIYIYIRTQNWFISPVEPTVGDGNHKKKHMEKTVKNPETNPMWVCLVKRGQKYSGSFFESVWFQASP